MLRPAGRQRHKKQVHDVYKGSARYWSPSASEFNVVIIQYNFNAMTTVSAIQKACTLCPITIEFALFFFDKDLLFNVCTYILV